MNNMNNMNIGFIGLGKLGLPCALAINNKGHQVWGYDIDTNIQTILDTKKIPYREEGVEELLQTHSIKLGNVDDVVDNSDIIFVPIQTPHEYKYEGCTRIPEERNDFNYEWLKTGIRDLSESIKLQSKAKVVIIISTVLPGTIEREIKPIISDNDKFKLCYNPFFIAMGTTVYDFLNPEFVLFGVDDEWAAKEAENFYKTLHDKPFYKTDIINAELIKVCYNTFIGMKIVYANTIMEICHKNGGNVDAVMKGIKLATDRVISPKYLNGGMGDGGGCLLSNGLVYTIDGVKNMEDIDVGDLVLTHDGTYKPVIETYKRPYSDKIYKITTKGLGTEFFTKDHPMMCSKDLREKYITNGKEKYKTNNGYNLGELESLPCSELTTDHYLVLPEKITPPFSDKTESVDYFKLAGYYLAEGSIWVRKDRNNKPSRVEFSFHKKEIKYINEVILLIKNIYPDSNPTLVYKKDIDNLGVSVRVNSIELATKLNDDFGKGSEFKVIPSWVYSSSIDKIGYLIRGMFRGDGYLGEHGMIYSTISQDLAYGCFILLKMLGIKSTIRTIKTRIGKDGVSHKKSYEIRVRNAVYVKKLSLIVEEENKHKMQDKKYELYPIKNGYEHYKIKSIEELDYSGTVYNINVDDNHTYVTTIGTVHNCHPRDNIAMSWLANKLDLSHNFFDDIMTAREDQTEFLINLILEHEAPYYILGKTFKEETNLIIGSPAILLKNMLNEKGVEVEQWDPFVDEEKPIFKKGTYFIATRHKEFKDFKFPEGSTVIDVWRYLNIKDEKINYIRVGINK